MKELRYRGGVVAASTQEDLGRFLVNDAKIRAGQCPNNCGPLVIETHGIELQMCKTCNFSTNTRRDA